MTNPHDALFQYTFSQPEHAARLIRDYLPASIAERIEWATLERLPGSLVDQELTWRHTDLLFHARISGREALIYVLLEHQSTVDPLMALRLLGYRNGIRPAGAFRIIFPSPVQGPICLGHSSHFGLGLFAPETGEVEDAR